ncbi:YbaK/EbsC family protein [Virgibacillus sp. MSJ-26]|uniref:YbaK/EbsC family protein n=1 Tax=Virgibacillus sp. MSJ-26 TaxID=2841522 RepID=UPI001C0F55B5|nr:YbaK/EbsC family protein [Virgibacillus sp. MSJ-26]MBU5466183.1 YbaK/EbsC family protein [Virgibacillus sp. MSJ-26]
MRNLTKHAKKVQEIIYDKGYTNKVVELPDSTRTAKEAASAIGCDVAQIAKSIVFRLMESNKPLLVIASGANRIDEKQIKKHLDDKLGKANADFVREHTGYVIGGVPPLGHTEPIQTYIDEDIFQFKDIWAAAGHPKAVVQLTPDELIEMTEGTVVAVK